MLTLLKNIFHFATAFSSAVAFRFPSRQIFVLGVTGTKGKSSTVELINAMFESAGKATALVSSVRVKIGQETFPNSTSNTMPGRWFLQQFLSRAVGAGCQYAFIEVTSQGVLQHRHRFIDFDAALVTNLHPEHIEAHGSFEAYRAAKVKFFLDVSKSKKSKKIFFINDAMQGKEYFEEAARASEVVYFSRELFIHRELASRYDLESAEVKKLLSGWLQHDFNVENVSAAVAFARSQGISWEIIVQALEKFHGVPGRMEYVSEDPFAVVVDYAHTPDSLRAVYQAMRRGTQGKLICVLGSAGGGRDKWKRPAMGEIAGQYCDHVILTNEDPYDESPVSIIEEIERGLLSQRKQGGRVTRHEKILNRRDAIAHAIRLANPRDAVVITGKGSEPWMHVARGKKIPWNERATVEDLLP